MDSKSPGRSVDLLSRLSSRVKVVQPVSAGYSPQSRSLFRATRVAAAGSAPATRDNAAVSASAPPRPPPRPDHDHSAQAGSHGIEEDAGGFVEPEEVVAPAPAPRQHEDPMAVPVRAAASLVASSLYTLRQSIANDAHGSGITPGMDGGRHDDAAGTGLRASSRSPPPPPPPPATARHFTQLNCFRSPLVGFVTAAPTWAPTRICTPARHGFVIL